MGAVKRVIEDAVYNIMKTFAIDDDDEATNYTSIFAWIMDHANLRGNILDQFYHANICPECVSLVWGKPCCSRKDLL
jgi:hypothetical protein